MAELKLVLGLAVLAAGALGGALPLRRFGREDAAGGRVLERAYAFSAGVFLAAGLVHLLPRADAAWRELGFDYPLAFALAAAAILLMLLFEHVLPPEEAHHALHAPSAERFSHLPEASPRGAYAVLIALSVHALLAGLALGTQRSAGGALVIFAALLAHKTVEGFALGVSLVRHGMPAGRAWTLLGLFALATPLGIALGAGLDAWLDDTTRGGLEATFLALAAGTFAYVATLDILREELQTPGDRLAKWLWVVVGAAGMGVLALWV